MKKLFVGNLPQEATESDLILLFEQVGEVASATLIMDRATGRSKGFGFVEMDNEDAERAIAEMDGLELEGHVLTVSEARPQAERAGGERGGFGGRPRDRERQGGFRGGRGR